MEWNALVLVLCVAGVLSSLILIPHNLRARRVRREALRLQPEEVREIHALLRALPATDGDQQLLFPSRRKAEDWLTASRIGGAPYAEKGDAWPRLAEGLEQPAPFLVQVRLDHPSLGKVWQGRLVTVFLRREAEQFVRSYASPSPARFVELPGGPPLVERSPMAAWSTSTDHPEQLSAPVDSH